MKPLARASRALKGTHSHNPVEVTLSTFEQSQSRTKSEMKSMGRKLTDYGWLVHYVIGPGPMGAEWVLYLKKNRSLVLHSYIDIESPEPSLQWEVLVPSDPEFLNTLLDDEVDT